MGVQFCAFMMQLVLSFMSVLIRVFCGSGLEELYASHCHLADLKRTVARYPALQMLDVSFNKIDDIKALVFDVFSAFCAFFCLQRHHHDCHLPLHESELATSRDFLRASIPFGDKWHMF